MMRLILFAALLAMGLSGEAAAQSYIRVVNCGDWKPPAGSSQGSIDQNGNICMSQTGSSGSIGGTAGITITNKSATITLGNATNQVAIAANTARVSCHVQPQGGDMWINPTSAATALDNPSEFLPALSEWTCPAGYKGAVGIAGATTATKFYADEGTVP